MLWYTAFEKEPGIHRVMDDPDLFAPSRSMTGIQTGTGLPSDSGKWTLRKIEAEEGATLRKLEGLRDWMFEHRSFLRDHPVRYGALQDLLGRFQRKIKRLKELKDALVR